jgi:hypothetical protein
LLRALAVMRLQQAVANSCGGLEEMSLLALMSVLADTRHKWKSRSVFKEWAALATKSQYKLIRGRPMAQPESRGLEALDPMEAAYRTYYLKELNHHNLDNLRLAATRIAGNGTSAGTRRANTAQSSDSRRDSKGDDQGEGDRQRQKASDILTGDSLSVRSRQKDEVPLHVLKTWIRAATPPAGMRPTRPDLTSKEIDTLQPMVGGTVLQKSEQENRRKTELLTAEMQARNWERKRMDDLMITLRSMGGFCPCSFPPMCVWALSGLCVHLLRACEKQCAANTMT